MVAFLSRCGAAPALALLLACPLAAAETVKVRRLEGQSVDDTTYFLVRLSRPAGLQLPGGVWSARKAEGLAHQFALARLPRLVAQDDRTSAVYRTAGQPAAGELAFVGKVRGKGPARLLLVYPTRTEKRAGKEDSTLAPSLRGWTWGEIPVTLDFARANRVELPKRERTEVRDPEDNDLEGRWAAGQAEHFAILEAQTTDFGFYAQARRLTMRKYHVPALSLAPRDAPSGDTIRHRLYETTTGAAALTESLAMHRLLRTGPAEAAARTIDIARIRGIEVGEHPWDKMMAGKKPAPEPLASLIPYDKASGRK